MAVKKRIKVVEPISVDVGEEKEMLVTQVEVDPTVEKDIQATEKELQKDRDVLVNQVSHVRLEFFKMVFLSNNLGSVRGPELTHEFTHKTNIELSPYDVAIQVLKYLSGKLYIQSLEKEKDKLEKTGLMRLKRDDNDKVTVLIPDWNLFMTALDSYYKMNGPY